MNPRTQAGRTRGADQAPEVGTWSRRLLGPFHVTGVFWYRLFVFGVRIVPGFLIAAMVWLWTGIFFLFLRGIRIAVANNLEWVLGPPRHAVLGRWRRAFRTLHNHAWCMTETFEGLAKGRRVEVETEGLEHWQSVAGSDGGLVLVTAHVGHWEVGSREIASEKRVHIVRVQELDPAAQRFLQGLLEQRAGGKIEFHFSKADDFALGSRLLKALRRGEIVALQGDRPREGARAEPVELFGQRLDLPVGPVALARAARVPLLPVFMLRQGRAKSLLVFRPPILVARTTDRSADQRAALREIAANVETAIRREPYQWFCLRDLWGRPTQTRRTTLRLPD